jgi:hypothetical protein
LYVISSAQVAPGCGTVVGGVSYLVASIDGKSIAFIRTSDTGFVTPEGLRIGSSVEDVRRAGGGEVLGEIGWAFYSKLPSGWRAVFSGLPEPRNTGAFPNDAGASVIAFFRTNP